MLTTTSDQIALLPRDVDSRLVFGTKAQIVADKLWNPLLRGIILPEHMQIIAENAGEMFGL